MAVNVKLSDETVEMARQQAPIFQRTLGSQVDYWAKIGRLAERYPGFTFEYLQKLMRENRLAELDNTNPPTALKSFSALRLKTRGYQFNRKDANER